MVGVWINIHIQRLSFQYSKSQRFIEKHHSQNYPSRTLNMYMSFIRNMIMGHLGTSDCHTENLIWEGASVFVELMCVWDSDYIYTKKSSSLLVYTAYCISICSWNCTGKDAEFHLSFGAKKCNSLIGHHWLKIILKEQSYSEYPRDFYKTFISIITKKTVSRSGVLKTRIRVWI